MRLPRPKFTIRLMMALLAVAALALSVEATRRRMANLSLAYLGRAREYQSKADVASVTALESRNTYRSAVGRPTPSTPNGSHRLPAAERVLPHHEKEV